MLDVKEVGFCYVIERIGGGIRRSKDKKKIKFENGRFGLKTCEFLFPE